MTADAARDGRAEGSNARTLGSWIRGERSAQDLTQRALAERAGVSRSYLGDIERGRGARPSIETLERLASAIGATRLDLFRAAGMLEPGGAEDHHRLAERRILAIFRDLSSEGRAAVERFARFAYHEEQAWTQPALLVEEDSVPGSAVQGGGLPLFDDALLPADDPLP